MDNTSFSYHLKQKYSDMYMTAARRERYYEQLAYVYDPSKEANDHNSALQQIYMGGLTPSQKTVPVASDIETDSLRDAEATIASVSRGNALTFSEQIPLNTYTNWIAEVMNLFGQNMQKSIELLPMKVALQDSTQYPTAARASIDAGTAAHKMSKSLLDKIESRFDTFKIPFYYDKTGENILCLINPDVYADILADTVILTIGEYSDPSIILNKELGRYGRIRFLRSPDAHVYYGTGSANATDVNTTLAADANALSKTMTVAANTNMAVGQRLTVGNLESSTTFYPKTEQVIVEAISDTTITISGGGINGGFEFDHSSGEVVNHNDSVYPTVFGGPKSIAKKFAKEVGEFGQVVGPKLEGNANHIRTLAWKWYGGYGTFRKNSMIHIETASGYDA